METSDIIGGPVENRTRNRIRNRAIAAFRERMPRTFSVVYVAMAAFVFIVLAPLAGAYDIVERVAVSSWRAFSSQFRYEKTIIVIYFRLCIRMVSDAWNRKPYGSQSNGADAVSTGECREEKV